MANDAASRIEDFISGHALYFGRFDLLWKRMEAHRIDERTPGDGTRIPDAELDSILTWLLRQSPDALRFWETGEKADRPTYRENLYAGPCAACGSLVAARSGRLMPKDGGRTGYDVLHLVGECAKGLNPPDATDHADGTRTRRVVGPTSRDFSAVTGGYYATVSPREDQDYDFWYVKEGRKEGYRFVKRVIGGQGPIRIQGGEAVRALVTILAEGVDVCGNRYSDEMGKCRDCGLPLTDEESRAARRGPVCRSK